MEEFQNLLGILGTIALLYGGGQIPPANQAIGIFAEKLLRNEYEVFGINKSFLGLADISCYEAFDIKKARRVRRQPGTYLAMCRGVDPSSNKWFGDIIDNLQSLDIHTLMLLGGDGSSRAGRDLVKRAKEIGYALRIVFVPCTIDGIANSDTIGLESAVAETLRHVVSMAVNAFATWHPAYSCPRIAVVEIQGRNRNDILLHVVKKLITMKNIGSYELKDINIVVVPAAYKWSYREMLDKVYADGRPTLILIAEGATPTNKNWKKIPGSSNGQKLETCIIVDEKREINLDIVGYLSQTNDSITESEIKKIKDWAKYTMRVLYDEEESVAVIKSGTQFFTMPLEKFANATESTEAIPLSKEEIAKLRTFLP